MPSLRCWAVQTSLLTTTAGRNLQNDPMGFGLLLARRFLPGGRADLASVPAGLWGAVGSYLADRPEAAAAALRARGRTGRRPGDPLAARLAIAVGAADAVPEHLAGSPRLRSDDAWARGDLSGALAELDGSSALVARRRRSELKVLRPGFQLDSVTEPRFWPANWTRVLHILTNSLPYTRSGYTSRTQAILRACAAQGLQVAGVTRLGYPVTVGRFGVDEVDHVDGIAYQRLLTHALPVELDARLMAQVRALDPVIQSVQPGVLHTTTDYTNALVTQAAAARYRLPWVYEMRGQLELSWVASRPVPLRAEAATSERVRLLRSKEAELAQKADAVVVLSEVQADDLVSRGVRRDSILVAPNSVDPELLLQDTESGAARSALGLSPDGVWAGTVSSLVDYEGLDTFLRALARVRAEGIDLRGAVVGDGVSRPGLMALARELGITDAVVFPGHVTRDETVRWHEALDIFVVPRRDTPVCRVVTPLKPVEAMAVGRPVLASDLPALREIVAVPGAGEVLPPSDVQAWSAALERLAARPGLRGELGQRGRSFASHRTWARVAQSYAQLYQTLAERDG